MKVKIEKRQDGKYEMLTFTGKTFLGKEKWASNECRTYENLEEALAGAKFLVTPYVEIVGSH